MQTLKRFSKNTLSPCTPNQKKIKEYVKVEKSHGRIETRSIRVFDFPSAYLGWNGVRQIIEIERVREKSGCISKEIVYAITSFSSDMVSAEELLCYIRRHWAIENELHHVRDVTFNEDRCRVRNRCKAQILAAIRNTAITLLRQAGFENITEGREWCAERRTRPIYMLFGRTE